MRIRRIVSVCLILLALVSVISPAAPKVSAAITLDTYNTRVQEFISDSRWKSGIAWGDNQKPKLSSWSSIGCCAYAADFVAYVYGSTSKAWTSSDFTKFTNLNDIRTGDIIHTSNHWFVVLERNGNTFYTAEGNFSDKTRVTREGWTIKDGSIYNLKATDGKRTFEYGYHYNFSGSGSGSTEGEKLSSTQVYYKIDFSAAVLKSRINQQVSSDCAVVSMATTEAYLHGATSAADKTTVYKALVSKNKDDNYAYWGNCGYVSYNSINWGTVYNQLQTGVPVLVHRPATSNKSEHWAVVCGYNGSTTTLEKDKFIIVDVYHGSNGTDIYTSKQWRGSTTIDRMVTRKNGIAVTGLSGIHMAINHPQSVHPYGNGHGVYGNVVSNSNLTSVQVMVTNANTGKNVFNKTVTPNAKSYSLYNLDSELTFAKWAEGAYFYTVIAKTASAKKVYQTYFTISSGWPATSPTRSYTFNIDLYGGSGTVSPIKVNYGSNFAIPTEIPTRDGYTFKGWNVIRSTDGKSYTKEGEWYTPEQIQANGYTPRLYVSGEKYGLSYEWIRDCMNNTGYTFVAVWEEAIVVDPPVVPDLPTLPNEDLVTGDTNGDGKVNTKDWLILYDHINEITELTGDALTNADVNGDGKVNMKDWIRLYNHITEVDPL